MCLLQTLPPNLWSRGQSSLFKWNYSIIKVGSYEKAVQCTRFPQQKICCSCFPSVLSFPSSPHLAPPPPSQLHTHSQTLAYPPFTHPFFPYFIIFHYFIICLFVYYKWWAVLQTLQQCCGRYITDTTSHKVASLTKICFCHSAANSKNFQCFSALP